MEHKDPDDILRAKQLTSTFIGARGARPGGPRARGTRWSALFGAATLKGGNRGAPSSLPRGARTEKYADSVRLLDEPRRRHVHSLYGERVSLLKTDLLRLFRLRSFDG